MLRRHSLSKRWNKGYADKCKAIAIISLLFLIFVVMNLGCTKNEAKVTEEKVMNVKVLAAEMKSFRPFVETIGTLKPNEEVIVSSEVDGIVKNLRVNEGSSVSKGMVLVEINETDYRLEVNRADAALRQAEASLANAKLEYERKASLYKEELVTKQQFDDISARLALADGELDRAKASLSLAKEKLLKNKNIFSIGGYCQGKKANKRGLCQKWVATLMDRADGSVKIEFYRTRKGYGKAKDRPGCSFQGRYVSGYGVQRKTRYHLPKPGRKDQNTSGRSTRSQSR